MDTIHMKTEYSRTDNGYICYYQAADHEAVVPADRNDPHTPGMGTVTPLGATGFGSTKRAAFHDAKHAFKAAFQHGTAYRPKGCLDVVFDLPPIWDWWITPKKENQAAVSAYNPKSAAWMAQKEMYWEHQTDLVPDALPSDLQLAFHHALGEVFGYPSEPKENGFWEPTVLGLQRIEFNVTHKGVVKLQIFKPNPSDDNRNPKYGYALSNVEGNLMFRHEVSHSLLQTLAEARQKSLEML